MKLQILTNGSKQSPLNTRSSRREPSLSHPHHQSRMEINRMIHTEMQKTGQVDHRERNVRVLVARQEITGADRRWAEEYEPGNIVRYTKGSKTHGIEAGEYSRVEPTLRIVNWEPARESKRRQSATAHGFRPACHIQAEGESTHAV
jgi:hypothetical protein